MMPLRAASIWVIRVSPSRRTSSLLVLGRSRTSWQLVLRQELRVATVQSWRQQPGCAAAEPPPEAAEPAGQQQRQGRQADVEQEDGQGRPQVLEGEAPEEKADGRRQVQQQQRQVDGAARVAG